MTADDLLDRALAGPGGDECLTLALAAFDAAISLSDRDHTAIVAIPSQDRFRVYAGTFSLISPYRDTIVLTLPREHAAFQTSKDALGGYIDEDGPKRHPHLAVIYVPRGSVPGNEELLLAGLENAARDLTASRTGRPHDAELESALRRRASSKPADRFARLRRAWSELQIPNDPEWLVQEQARDAAAPAYRAALERFLVGEISAAELRSATDSLSKSQPHFGFRGNGQMFFNILEKAAEPEALGDALRRVLAVPGDDDAAHRQLDDWYAAVSGFKARAEQADGPAVHHGFTPFFVTFFWELQARDAWPAFFPNSRDVLHDEGLLQTADSHWEHYRAFREVTAELRTELGATTWQVEQLLWRLGKGAETTPTTTSEDIVTESPAIGATFDLYAGLRDRGLTFPDTVVTSFIASLAAKPFAILSGLSGTGKTQLALGLIDALQAYAHGTPEEVDPPIDSEHAVYLKLTEPRIRRGRTRIPFAMGDRLGRPDRGSARPLTLTTPEGETVTIRLHEVGFADPEVRQTFLKLEPDARAWIERSAEVGDYLELQVELGSSEGTVAIHRRRTVQGATHPNGIVVPVRSDWTDPRGLVGFFNPITRQYLATPMLELLLEAEQNPETPYVVLLDEMNLSRVEHYFSDFLSAMESGKAIPLFAASLGEEVDGESGPISPDIKLPPNLSIVGTVNIDETTFAFSPKVLDRANVIEFDDVDLGAYFARDGASTGGLRLKGGAADPRWFAADEASRKEWEDEARAHSGFVTELVAIHELAKRHRRHFGFRVASEVGRFVGFLLQHAEGSPDETVRIALDLQLCQKVLPKVAGGREIAPYVTELLEHCRRPVSWDDESEDGTAAARYPAAARKLERLLNDLEATGFANAL